MSLRLATMDEKWTAMSGTWKAWQSVIKKRELFLHDVLEPEGVSGLG
jgi:hypothetical protein